MTRKGVIPMTVTQSFSRSALSLILTFTVIPYAQNTFGAAAAQDKPTVIPAPVTIHPPAPALQGNANGTVRPFKRMQRSLKDSILSHPVPQVSLVFILEDKRSAKITVELPAAARKLLLDCWKAELAFYYKKAFEPSRPDKRINDKYALGGVNSTVLSGLEGITIDTPTGRRKISWDEAGDLVRFMAEAAQQVIAQATQSMGTRPLA
jgi:hypothetical protein